MSDNIDGIVAKTRAVGWAVLVTVSVLVITMISNLVVGMIVGVTGFAAEGSSVTVFVMLSTVAQTGVLLVGYLYTRLNGGLQITFRVSDNDCLRWSTVGPFVIVIATAALLAIVDPGLLRSESLKRFVEQGTGAVVAVGVLMILIAPPIEEYVFRGVIQQRLRNEFTSLPAIVGATVLFWFLHFGDYGSWRATAIGLSMVFIAGLMYGTLYEQTDSPFLSTLAHSIYNSIVYISFII